MNRLNLPDRQPPKLSLEAWEYIQGILNLKEPGWQLPDENVGSNELPDVPDGIPDRLVSGLDKDKIQNLIDWLQGQEKPGWDPIPPEMKPEMDDIIAILQNYQRVETPNAEELLRRSKKTSGGS